MIFGHGAESSIVNLVRSGFKIVDQVQGQGGLLDITGGIRLRRISRIEFKDQRRDLSALGGLGLRCDFKTASKKMPTKDTTPEQPPTAD